MAPLLCRRSRWTCVFTRNYRKFCTRPRKQSPSRPLHRVLRIQEWMRHEKGNPCPTKYRRTTARGVAQPLLTAHRRTAIAVRPLQKIESHKLATKGLHLRRPRTSLMQTEIRVAQANKAAAIGDAAVVATKSKTPTTKTRSRMLRRTMATMATMQTAATTAKAADKSVDVVVEAVAVATAAETTTKLR